MERLLKAIIEKMKMVNDVRKRVSKNDVYTKQTKEGTMVHEDEDGFGGGEENQHYKKTKIKHKFSACSQWQGRTWRWTGESEENRYGRLRELCSQEKVVKLLENWVWVG